MPGAAAFFDLDRTLVGGASGPLLTEALVAAGVAPDRPIPGQGIFYRAYELLGENLVGMALARGAAALARGWDRSAVQDAAKQAAEHLADGVMPYAAALVDEHQAAGRAVVLATTTPYDLVAPLAERLGFDDVVATRYGEAEGRYTGAIEGGFVWFTGKLAAVRRWADDHGVSLGESWAYSDSIYDLPLLMAVGHPTAVNPDARLRAVATLRRWPVRFLDAPPGVPKLAGVEPQDAMRVLFGHTQLYPYARFDIDGTDRIPRQGPAILAANHRSYFDPVAVGLTAMRSGRPVRALGKKEVFDAPVVGQLARALGGIVVDRKGDPNESIRPAAEALEAGELVVVMPQGTIPRGEAFFDTVLTGKTGAARLAAMTRAPVVPIGVWGTEHVWPRSERLPHVWNVANPPTVRVRVGAQVALGYDDARADTERIMEAIVALLPPEARVRRLPSEGELRLAKPPG